MAESPDADLDAGLEIERLSFTGSSCDPGPADRNALLRREWAVEGDFRQAVIVGGVRGHVFRQEQPRSCAE